MNTLFAFIASLLTCLVLGGLDVCRAGVEKGLVVVVGCSEPATLIELSRDSGLVHALDTDQDNVRQARKFLQEKGLYGRISVHSFDGSNLPYTADLVNKIVIEGC